MLQFGQMRHEEKFMGVLGKTCFIPKGEHQNGLFSPEFSLCIIRSRTLAAVLVRYEEEVSMEQQGKLRESQRNEAITSIIPHHHHPSGFS